MKYNVSGAHRDTGARMTLEFEADSKAAAERKAAQAGMEVRRVVPIEPGHAGPGTGGRRTGVHPVLKLALLLGLITGFWLFAWPTLRGWL